MMQLAHFRFAFDISPFPMLLASGSGEILLSNALCNQLFEYESTELDGKNVDILVPETPRQHHSTLRDAYFTLPSKRQMGQGRDLYGVTRTGRLIPVEISLDSITVGDDLFTLAVVVDIRERKLHDERMNLAMDAAASAMIMTNRLGVIIFANKSAINLFGYEESLLLNNPIELLVPQETQRAHPVYRNSFTAANKARSMAKKKSLHAVHRDGHKIPVEIALTPIETPNGNMVMSTIIDLTERVSAERAATIKAEELERANSELSQFAYSASHDLKAPLSSNIGLLNLCLEDLKDGNQDEVRRNIEKCLEIIERSSKKIEGVLNIAKVGHDDAVYELQDLETIIQDTWSDLVGTNENDIQLTLELGHSGLVSIKTFAFKVILENLLSNAIRYCDHGKPKHCINVSTHCDNMNIYFSVADNGIGIPCDKQHVIFDMFKNIDERSEDGLGMALVKKHIDHLGGKIAFTSKVGDGTTFDITLPLHHERLA